MSSLEVTIFGALWIIVAFLTCLVLLLYRQMDKAYGGGHAEKSSGLLPGSEAPDIELLTEEGIGPLKFPLPRELALFAFLTTTCDECLKLVPIIADESNFPGRAIGLVSGEDRGEIRSTKDGRFKPYWVADPGEVMRSYGVSITPYVYVVRGRTILAGRAVASRSGLESLLKEAEEYERTRGGSQASADSGSPAALLVFPEHSS